MIWIALGAWRAAYGRWFTRERIYVRGYIWTPFVRVRWRYRRTEAWDVDQHIRFTRGDTP